MNSIHQGRHCTGWGFPTIGGRGRFEPVENEVDPLEHRTEQESLRAPPTAMDNAVDTRSRRPGK
ncbi:hypothetical protein DVS28_a3257 [Euzebya pacifica]|uniref:Uncharacterized protein n=1 Tax=Euzebya pacifica TaxID=1608957 RepID=A0A346Y0D5_9ACTN|nr:hypothetical protein DVS28_a3257 [Euzebya pacifica]